MHKRITFKNMEHSDVIEQYANQQLAKIEHFLLETERTPMYIDLVMEPSKIHEHHKIELRIKTPRFDLTSGHEFHHGEHFYDILDRVIDVMYRRLHEENKKLKVDDRKMIGRHDDFKKQR